VIIGFSEEFDTAGLCEGIESTENLRAILVELLKDDSRYAEGDFESALESFNQIQEQTVCGQVTFVGNFSANGGVSEFVKISC
jgi:hypothetical protein